MASASGYHRPRRGGSSRGNPRGRGGRRPNYGGDRPGGNVVILGYKAFEKLRDKDPDDIVLDLASDRCLPALKTLLAKTEMTKDMIELIVEVLARSCDSNSPQYFNKLLIEIPKSMFVILHMKSHITRLPYRNAANTNPQLFLECTVKLFSEILKKIPTAFESLPLGDLEQAVAVLAMLGRVSDQVKQDVEQLKVIKEESLEKERRREEMEEKRKIRSRNPERGSIGDPPEDFREMTIIPEYNDIYAEKEPYLRRNIVEGRYENLDHYLDVQFRLLREDFLRPLREGIVNLVSRGIDEKQGMFKDIRVYRNVKILHPECSHNGLLHQIEFDNSRLRRVRWENSKRLIFGSLLCLSKDHFQSFIFATVANRDAKDLVHGRVTVQFMDTTFDTQDFSRKNVYQMVETTAYFEAYSPILKGLQQTKEDDLPFQRYLVECSKDIHPPKYLQHNRFVVSAPTFDFTSILCENPPSVPRQHPSLLNQFGRLSLNRHGLVTQKFDNVPVVEVDRWPNREQLGLDDSQYKALQIALTREVAVIQGPPGTGKTYLGLKIAKILLSNKEKWIQGEATGVGRHREVHQTPILVICYTNHALDQFLEGIYDFHDGNNDEDKIVRIGGRSKSEKLKECNLRAIKSKGRKRSPSYVRRGMYEVHRRREAVESKMQRSSNVLRKCWQNILYERTLQQTGVVNDGHFRSLMRPFIRFNGKQPDQGTVVLQWLNLATFENGQEETVIFGEEMVSFNGRQEASHEGLPFAETDFTLCTNIKTTRPGCIVCSVPENRKWLNNSKALFIDAVGVIKFISGPNVLGECHSRVNDGKWHEVAAVYSDEDKRLALYVDKRMESIQVVALPEDDPQHGIKIGCAPQGLRLARQNFVGEMKKFVYYRSTKYSDLVMGNANVEYEIEFMQEQRKVDDHDDMFDKPMSKNTQLVDDFDVIDPSKLVMASEGGWEVQNKGRLKKKIGFEIRKQLQSEDVMTEAEASRCIDVWQLAVKERWRLYRKWVREISQQHQNTIASIQGEYDAVIKELKDLRNADDYELLKEAHVIGMTTTGAAKYRELLHRIKPKITIVEEAAEVLESHIVTALTVGCEHLILIGDHKQLRPKPAVFQLGLDYQLDISLFERMVENGMPFACLGAQHRMRPEIAIMMRPIYDNLSDHDSVLNFEHIKGISKDIFFVNHQEREDALDENRSSSNLHEAKFIGSLCGYLLKQGYSPSQITVLTPYTGQLFQLKKFIPNVKDLRVCVVDNFQGEENDIILLSLVRSQEITTKEKRDIRRLIGFLAIDNRICVSLSRAKKGFFCIGNLTLMRSANDLWSKILDDMEERGSVGNDLPLACQNHPGTITRVTNAMDFNKAPNGGCSVPCLARLACGHRCEQICHPQDPAHLEYDCRKNCPKTCERGHPCTRLCYQDCNKCMIPVSKVVPRCGHTMQMPCHQDPSMFLCTMPCPKIRSCGHVCSKKCGEPCVRKCLKEVEKTWSTCGHTNKTSCYVDPAKAECTHPCRDLLKCEHLCSGTCAGCKQGRLHKPCSSKCGRVRFCDHACKVPCTKNCPPCPEPCPNKCPHSKCGKKCGDPCAECKERCEWRCIHLRCTRLCGELCNRSRCNIPCKKLKKCGHQCAGLCGEPCPKKCLVCNKEEMTEILFGNEDEEDARFLELTDCGHVFEVTGMDQYMEMQKKELTKGQATSIQIIKCPKCKKAIRTSLRYGNIIKSILHDFEDVKRAIASGRKSSETAEFLRSIMDEIAKGNLESGFPDEVYEIKTTLQDERGLTNDHQNIVENQVQFLKFMMKLKAILKAVEPTRNPFLGMVSPSVTAGGQEIEVLKRELQTLVEWVMAKRIRFSEQELEDFNEELLRSWIMFSHKILNVAKERKNILLTNTLSTMRMEYIKTHLESGKKLNESQKEKCMKYIEYITLKHPSLLVKYTTVTEDEKKMIVKTMGFEQGHWFKCPKGHFYCIGDCGGATEEAKCPECGSKIGGTQHRLATDNVVAPEMDGARFGAWSETANNMRNWRFDD